MMNRNTRRPEYLKSVSGSIRIDAPTKKVWEVISRPGNLKLCHPFCEANPVERWPGPDSIDHIQYYNGLKFQRIFTDWMEGIGYDLRFGRKNGKKSKVIWRINQTDAISSELKITIHPHDTSRYPDYMKPLISFFYIQPMLGKYLSSVLKGFQWYVLRRQPVQKNQFGIHKWFSN